MKELSTYIPNVFVINMDNDSHRLQNITKQLDDLHIPFERFSAINGSTIKKHEKIDNLCSQICTDGIKGCAISHITLWKFVIDNNLSNALILEDDAVFIDDFTSKFISFYESVPKDYDIIQLGCVFGCNTGINASNIVNNIEQITNMIPTSEQFYNKLNYISGTHAYIISNKGAKILYNNISLKTHLDVQITTLIKPYNLIIYSPPNDLITQVCLAMESSLTTKFPKLLLTLLDKINLFQNKNKNVSVGWIMSESLAKIWLFDITGIFLILLVLALFSNYSLILKIIITLWLITEVIYVKGAGIQYLILFLVLSNILYMFDNRHKIYIFESRLNN